jgi:hypothetical protein
MSSCLLSVTGKKSPFCVTDIYGKSGHGRFSSGQKAVLKLLNTLIDFETNIKQVFKHLNKWFNLNLLP